MEELKKESAEYIPGTNYVWDAASLFTMNGLEFGYMYNVLQIKKTELIRDLEMINIFESKLKEAVKSGVAYPKPEVKIEEKIEEAPQKEVLDKE